MNLTRVATCLTAVSIFACAVVRSGASPVADGTGDETTNTSESELKRWYSGATDSGSSSTTKSASYGSQEEPPEEPMPTPDEPMPAEPMPVEPAPVEPPPVGPDQETVPSDPVGGHSLPKQNEVPPRPLPQKPEATDPPATDAEIPEPPVEVPPTPVTPHTEPARLNPATPMNGKPPTQPSTPNTAAVAQPFPVGASCGSQPGCGTIKGSGQCGSFPVYQGANVACQPYNTQCFQATLCDRPCQNWTIFTGALFLNKNNPDGLQMFVDTATPSRVMDADSFDFGSQTGVEVAATRHRALGNFDYELRYFGVNDWDSLQSLRFDGNPIRINNSTPTFVSGPRRIISTYSSELQNFEWNLIHPNGNGTSWVFGFRHIQLNERLNSRFRSLLTPPISTEDYRIDTQNRLYGLQGGMNRVLFGDCGSCVEVYGRAGLYLNDAQQRSALINYLTPVRTFANRERDTQLSFVNEVGLRSRLKIKEGLNFVASYRGLWVNDVALASDQIPTSTFAGGSNLNNSSSTFYHGGTFGLEVRF